jgi:hypothetical protein
MMDRGLHVKFEATTSNSKAKDKHIKEWVRFVLSARKIQRVFRSWQRLAKLRVLLKSRRG